MHTSTSMEYAARTQNLNQVSRELDTKFLELAHREQLLAQSISELTSLRAAIVDTRKILCEQQALLNRVTARLPSLARNEAMDRVKQRLDAMPFENLASSAALNRGH